MWAVLGCNKRHFHEAAPSPLAPMAPGAGTNASRGSQIGCHVAERACSRQGLKRRRWEDQGFDVPELRDEMNGYQHIVPYFANGATPCSHGSSFFILKMNAFEVQVGAGPMISRVLCRVTSSRASRKTKIVGADLDRKVHTLVDFPWFSSFVGRMAAPKRNTRFAKWQPQCNCTREVSPITWTKRQATHAMTSKKTDETGMQTIICWFAPKIVMIQLYFLQICVLYYHQYTLVWAYHPKPWYPGHPWST